jgi:hypothetical protein
MGARQMADLLNCPFCGAALIQLVENWIDHPKSDCVLSRLAVHRSKFTAWNTRSPDPALSARVAELEAGNACVEVSKRISGVKDAEKRRAAMDCHDAILALIGPEGGA